MKNGTHHFNAASSLTPSQSQPNSPRRTRRLTQFSTPVLVAIFCGCATVQTERSDRDLVTATDSSQIYVTPSDVPGNLECRYRVLGKLKYAEPFSANAIDAIRVKSRLTELAAQTFHGDADAVVKVVTHLDDRNQTVTVEGVAIRIESDLNISPRNIRAMCLSPIAGRPRADPDSPHGEPVAPQATHPRPLTSAGRFRSPRRPAFLLRADLPWDGPLRPPSSRFANRKSRVQLRYELAFFSPA
jgi:hypothetical protein